MPLSAVEQWQVPPKPIAKGVQNIANATVMVTPAVDDESVGIGVAVCCHARCGGARSNVGLGCQRLVPH